MADPRRAILITGISRGFGLQYAKHQISRGETVVGVARRHPTPLSSGAKSDPQVLEITADFSSPEELAQIPNVLRDRNLVVDRIVHAAGGGLGHRDPLLSRNEFDQLVAANLSGALEINRLLIPRMQELGFGCVVHIGSTAATQAIGSVGYNTVKAALGAYVRSAGRELIHSHVILAGINPGAFIVSGNAMDRLREKNSEAFDDFLNKKLPRGKMMTADDLFPMVDLLLDPSAFPFAGSMIAIDAGESVSYDGLQLGL